MKHLQARPFFLYAATLFALVAIVIPLSMTGQNVGANGFPNSDLGAKWSRYDAVTDTTAYTLAATPASGNRIYVYQAWCLNTSVTATVAFLQSGSTVKGVIPCSPGSKWNRPTVFDPPIAMPPNAVVTLKPAASITTLYLGSQGTVAP